MKIHAPCISSGAEDINGRGYRFFTVQGRKEPSFFSTKNPAPLGDEEERMRPAANDSWIYLSMAPLSLVLRESKGDHEVEKCLGEGRWHSHWVCEQGEMPPESTRAEHGLEKGSHLTMTGSWARNTGKSVTGVMLTNTPLFADELWILKDMLQQNIQIFHSRSKVVG